MRRGVAAAIGLGALALAGTAAGAPDPNWDNLPAVQGQGQGAWTDTISYVTPAEQWIRIPRLMTAVDAVSIINDGAATPTCIRRYGEAACTPPIPQAQRLVANATVYPYQQAETLRESDFTDFPATTVRTVAFGSIPVEATVELSLPTDSEGLPVGLNALALNDEYADPNTGPYAGKYGAKYQIVGASTVTGRVNVRVSKLSVDGVSVAVGAGCRTNGAATLDGHGVGYVAEPGVDPTYVPAGSYNPLFGGEITGTLDVPAFTGCGQGGDDLSALVSTMASGHGFPVTIEQGTLSLCWSNIPQAIKDGSCSDPQSAPFPSRPAS